MKQQSKTIQKKAFIGILCSVILIFLDQFTKYLAVQHLKDQMPVVLWKNVLELSYLENRGAAFGIFQGKQWPLIIFTVIVLILIIYFYLMRIPSEKHFGLLNGIAILFFAGAIGNFIDRVTQRYVVDFFYFRLINFPVFNVADIYVTVAAVLLILCLLFYKEEDFERILPTKKKSWFLYTIEYTYQNGDFMKQETFEIEAEYEGERLDKYLSVIFEQSKTSSNAPSRSFFQKLIRDGHVKVNDSIAKANYRLRMDDLVCVEIPDAVETPILPEDIPLDILYEDDDLLVVNKPKGMVVHPSAGHYSGTLVNAIMFHCKDSLSGINGEIRPGIVHRIDMDTTGSLIVCKNDESHVKIAEQIKEHSVNRRYRGIVYGVVKDDEGTINAPIGRHPTNRKKMAINEKNGKPAITHYKVLERFSNYTYMEFKLETGRTHQIRVHMASIGHPLLGDTVYSSGKSPFKTQGQTLHAMTIGFIHPRTNEYMEISAPLPEYFLKILKSLH